MLSPIKRERKEWQHLLLGHTVIFATKLREFCAGNSGLFSSPSGNSKPQGSNFISPMVCILDGSSESVAPRKENLKLNSEAAAGSVNTCLQQIKLPNYTTHAHGILSYHLNKYHDKPSQCNHKPNTFQHF